MGLFQKQLLAQRVFFMFFPKTIDDKFVRQLMIAS
jgi:hypothetical protein